MRKTNLGPFPVMLISFILIFFLFLIVVYSQDVLSLGSISVDSVGDRIRITSKITDEDGYPIPGVSITFINEHGILGTAITTEGGNFRFDFYRELWTRTITLKIELAGFATMSRTIDLPYPPPPPRKEPDKPEQPDRPPPAPPSDIKKAVLKNREGITFDDGKVIDNIEEKSYDICFMGGKFFVKEKRGWIATVGDQGNKSLLDINYPSNGYCDSIKLIKNHVYLYLSYTGDIMAEIKVESFERFKEVRITYHVRREEKP